MANLTPTLKITRAKAAGTTQDNLAILVTDSLALKAPSRGPGNIICTTAGAASIIVPASTDNIYLYIRHTATTDGSSSGTAQVDVENTDNEAFARLKAGEFLFMPFSHAGASVGVQLQSTSGSIMMEYAFWTAA